MPSSARGGKCQHCHHRERQGLAPLKAGATWRPRPDLAEREHATDCAKGLPLAASTVRDPVRRVLELTGLPDLLAMHARLDDALADQDAAPP